MLSQINWPFSTNEEQETTDPLLNNKPKSKAKSWTQSGSIFGNHSEKNRRQKLWRFGCIFLAIACGIVFGIVVTVYFSNRRGVTQPVHNSVSTAGNTTTTSLLIEPLDLHEYTRRLSGDDCSNQYSVVWLTTDTDQSRITLQMYDCDGDTLETQRFLGRRRRSTETDYFCMDNSFDGNYEIIVSASDVTDSVTWTMYDDHGDEVTSGGAPASLTTCSSTDRPTPWPTIRPSHVPTTLTPYPTLAPTTTDTVGVEVSFELTGATYATPTNSDVEGLRTVLESDLVSTIDSSAVLKNLQVSSSSSSSTSSSSSGGNSRRKLATYTWTTSFSIDVSLSGDGSYTSASDLSTSVESTASSSSLASAITSASIGGGVSIDETTISSVALTRNPSQAPTQAPITITTTDDPATTSNSSSSSSGMTGASIGFIIGAIFASISVLYCASLHWKFLTCTTSSQGDQEAEAREAARSRLDTRRSEYNTAITRRQSQLKTLTFAQIKGYKGKGSSLDGDNIDNTCAICINDMEDHEMVKLLPNCQHCYHGDCLDEWLRRSTLCPLCKQEVMPTSKPPHVPPPRPPPSRQVDLEMGPLRTSSLDQREATL
mmetsp:Transcript_14430/g.17149  ORF Transcript_14430/g.17149 Transcript_14430/m.17149 type:complete len:598 (+) Transcript_14430:94-1887(+)